ncbi:gliding motility protein GldN [Parabacteroides sp. 52]|uniref:type IX secretion system ring protein PorN/GldN n=1 Tax=Parabacteroides sp. 52 TaxID=2302940 RepID=UPI0013D08C12|nr:gliding motility protein GldN [Parabacteroides sp. 52]NDV56389.1 gliding motility protein GldN [Parabacteroides sp. 52]
MKHLYYILVLLSAFCVYSVEAQEPPRRTPQATRGGRAETQKNTGLPDLTVRAQDMNERNTQQVGNARWMRVLYRNVDLSKEVNAPLYYPVRPLNGSMNLFTTIFQLMSEGKLVAYEYNSDGYEAFDEEHIVNFKDVLDRAYIYYEEVPGRPGEPSSFVINEGDIPSGDVQSYYVKEAWYFDQNNSIFDVKILAISPILTTTDDYGATQTMPLFWLPYENIRPYINTTYIMTSSINNAKTFTIDDYFRRRMFEGDIIKTENLMNKTMQELYPQPDSLQLAQKAIETQLETFEKSLWFQPDTTAVVDSKADKKAKKKTSVRGRVSSTTEKEKAASTQTTKAAKAPKAEKSSAPVRSVRRTR